MYGTSASWKGCVFCALLLLVPLWAGEMENKETRNSLYASIRRQTLGEITLSSRPSREDVRTYIRRIAEADRGLAQDNYVFDDATHALKHRMLERVGREHLDVLLMNLPDRDVASYCLHRINNVVTEEDKDLIIEWLEDDSRLGIVVAAHRWALDARPVLVRKLVAHPRWVSEHCIYSIAQLRDPSTYDDLRWYFVNGSYPGFTYDAIKDVPGIGLTEEMIQRAWTGDTSGYKMPTGCGAPGFRHARRTPLRGEAPRRTVAPQLVPDHPAGTRPALHRGARK